MICGSSSIGVSAPSWYQVPCGPGGGTARVFALAHAGVTGPDMADLFLATERAIVRMACRATGPYVVSVSRDGLRRLRLAYPPG